MSSFASGNIVSGFAKLQRKLLGLGEGAQPVANRDAAGGGIEKRRYHCFGLADVKVENQGLHGAVRGRRQRQRAVAERKQRERAERLRGHFTAQRYALSRRVALLHDR